MINPDDRYRQFLRALLCVVLNGEHEFYLERTRTRIFQRCIVCGHETRGWDVNPDRPPIIYGTRTHVGPH